MKTCPICKTRYANRQTICNKDAAVLVRSRRVPRWLWASSAAVLALAIISSGLVFFPAPPTISKHARELDKAHHYGLGGIFRKLACARGDGKACDRLGLMYALGTGVVKDNSLALALFSKACDAGNAGGCVDLGAMYLFGIGVTENDLHAEALFSKGCDQGDAHGCTNLGRWYLTGKGGNRYHSDRKSTRLNSS